MARSHYVQATLLPPEVVEATVRIGVVGSADHVQVQVEVRDGGTDELLAMWSAPHGPYRALADQIERAAREAVKMISEVAGPF